MSQGVWATAAVVVIALAGLAKAADLGLAALPKDATPMMVELTADDLYGGLEAHRVVREGNAAVLDTRNGSVGGLPGRILTDVIDLGDGAVVSTPVKIGKLIVAAAAQPAGGQVVVSLRHGPTFFQAKGWGDWQAVAADKAVDVATDRYIQLRVELNSDKADVRPAVKGIKLTYTRAAIPVAGGEIKVVEAKIEKIVNSTIEFGYERMDQADLKWFRESAKLDNVIKDKKSEIDKLIALNLWVAQRKNDRGADEDKHMGPGPYPWNIRKVFNPEGGGVIYGHCGSYCEVFVTAACALGWQARHNADLGYRENSHETAEVWVNELRKWVYMDPSLATHYTDRKTGVPMSSLEMHDALADFILKEGETMRDIIARGAAAKDRVEGLSYDNLRAKVNTFDWTYGENIAFEWQTKQGVMTKGFVQMTPRNNFHGQPEPALKEFGAYPLGKNGFPFYTDARTPLFDGTGQFKAFTRNWFTRKRDFEWTLNQASMRLVRAGGDTVTVELGNSQPHFAKYVATVNGKEQDAANPFAWKLQVGKNTLVIHCVDALGQKGIASSVTVEQKK